MTKGLAYGVAAYTLWGVLPVYWKLLGDIPPLETVAHRTVWSFVFVAGLVLVQRRWGRFWHTARQRRAALTYLAIASLIGVNWLIYIYAVNSGNIVEASLGYFVNPLLSVLLGVLFLHEHLRPGQWTAIALAAAGVLYLTWQHGSVPWIGLGLALTFGLYGLLKKAAPVEAVEGMGLETAWLSLPALAFLTALGLRQTGAFGRVEAGTNLLLVLTGPITATPLLLFAAAARRIPLSAVGILQYIAPTLQFLLGVLVYAEPFDQPKLIGFATIWLALAIYTVEGVVARRRLVASAQTAVSLKERGSL